MFLRVFWIQIYKKFSNAQNWKNKTKKKSNVFRLAKRNKKFMKKKDSPICTSITFCCIVPIFFIFNGKNYFNGVGVSWIYGMTQIPLTKVAGLRLPYFLKQDPRVLFFFWVFNWGYYSRASIIFSTCKFEKIKSANIAKSLHKFPRFQVKSHKNYGDFCS